VQRGEDVSDRKKKVKGKKQCCGVYRCRSKRMKMFARKKKEKGE